ncbi:ABC transporter permease [soil metagenome]
MKPVFLLTDLILFVMVGVTIAYVLHVRATPHLRATWGKAFHSPMGACTATLLALFLLVGLLDSVHYRPLLEDSTASTPAYSPATRSMLDLLLSTQEASREKNYSAPLAWRSFDREGMVRDGHAVRDYPRLAHGGVHLDDPETQWAGDVIRRGLAGVAGGVLAAMALAAICAALLARHDGSDIQTAWIRIAQRRTWFPIRPVIIMLAIVLVIAGPIVSWAQVYHVFGTDRVGTDLLYVVMKAIRTAVVIGTMTTLVTLPFAVGLGIMAGYLRGWVDEVIQYVYTVINSIPYVLTIAAAVLILMVFIDNNPQLFQTSAERTDARLFFLCVILGMTSWTELCRLIRGEVLKLRELDYVQAAQAFGVSNWRIMVVHLLPNVVHLILINIVISFSGLVLAEAVLSYIGVGVDPAMASFGTLINTARLELSREPAVWWTLATAFTFMFTLVLSANLFADAVRDAFDPRAIHR